MLRGVLLCVLPGCVIGMSAQAQGTSSAVEATTVSTAAPTGAAYDTAGNLYIALRNDHTVVRVDTAGLITTVAGTGEQGFGGDGGPATAALLDSPSGVAVDANGNVFIADTRNQRVREVSGGTITTIAGTGVIGFGGDNGLAAAALLDGPRAVSLSAAGDLYIADTGNHRIRRISGGVITTVAGDGEQTFSGDGGPAISAGLDSPDGVAADTVTPGKFYISDTHNQRIRVVTPAGLISTVAGTGLTGSVDGQGTNAAFARPRGLAVDTNGAVYLADSGNHRIRVIKGTIVSTFAGDGEQGFAGDTGSAVSAVFDTPGAVAVDTSGTVAVADTHNQRTRAIRAGTINTVAGTPPPLTEGILLSGNASSIYGTGSLTATFTNGAKIATGNVTLLDGGVSLATAALEANQASFSLSALDAGVHTLAVAYAGDTSNAATASGVFVVTANQADQTITFPQPASPVVYAIGLTETLNATSSAGLPITYTVASGPATISGAALTFTGGGAVVVMAQAGSRDYVTATANRTVTVTPATPVVTWANPADIVFGTALGGAQLNASSPVAGTFQYTPASGTVPGGGSQTLSVTFVPADPATYTGATQTVKLLVRPATPVVTFPPESYTIVGTQLSQLQLDAVATGVTGLRIAGAYVYSPAAGSLVAAGPQILTVRFTPDDQIDYTAATGSVTLNGTPVTLASVSPATALLGDPAKTIVVTGTGFASNSKIEVNGGQIPTTYINNGSLTAAIPASNLAAVQTLSLSVFNPDQNQTSASLPFSVTAPPVAYTIAAPSTSQPGTQPTVKLTLTNSYPAQITGILTLSFKPGPNGVDDPAVQFASGGRSLKFSLAAGQTATPDVQLQTGTVTGVIQIALTLSAGGVDVTPAGTQPTLITVPTVVPGITQVTLTPSGRTLTVTTHGFSNTREVTQAVFHFTPAAGQTIATPDVTLDVTSIFAGWFSQAASDVYGSEFLYTQTFTLDDDASIVVGQVSVTLGNGVGTSAAGTTP